MACRPNRATGSRTSLMMALESCWGNKAASPTAYGLEYRSCDFGLNRGTIQSQLIRSDRMQPPPQAGKQAPGGTITGEFQPNGPWMMMLRHALCNTCTTTGSGPTYTHNFKGEVVIGEGLTFEEKFVYPDGTAKRFRWLGSRVNEFFLSVPTNDIVECRATVLSKLKDDPDPTTDLDATPVYPSPNEPFNSFQAALFADLDGSGTRVALAGLQTFDLTINNNIDPNQFALDGTPYRSDLPEDVRAISGNCRLQFTDTNLALFDRYKNNDDMTIQCRFTRGALSCYVTLPKIKITGDPSPKIPGRGPLDLNASYQAFRDDATGTDIQVQVVNNDPSMLVIPA